MSEPGLRSLATMSPFDEAREEIARWEKLYPAADHVAMVVTEPNGIEFTITGEGMRQHEAAGIFFLAAQTVAE